MTKKIFPDGYKPILDVFETEQAIAKTRMFFQKQLEDVLNLSRASAPLFVLPESGLNDNLNGTERPVSFGIKALNDKKAEIVHSLAKWKRYALGEYGYKVGSGLYTNMNAIRRDEDLDNIHSIYVDQWDWEKIIDKSERTVETYKDVVRKIYKIILNSEQYTHSLYPQLKPFLVKEIQFITSQELLDMYPDKTPKEREYLIAKRYGAVSIMQIGDKLSNGKPHDGRAPDYDDWKLNGDILVYYPVLDIALELSSMGIRVDENSIVEQLKKSKCTDRCNMLFQKAIIEKRLPYTIGGGIGQSRMSLLLLQKAHIGEVQVSIWTDEIVSAAKKQKVHLL